MEPTSSQPLEPIVEAPVVSAPEPTQSDSSFSPISSTINTAISETHPGNTLAIISLVLSILLLSPISLVLGIIALNKSKKEGEQNILALAAIAISVIGLVGTVSMLLYLIISGAYSTSL